MQGAGNAMNLYGNYGQYAVSMKDSALELTGGDAKAEGEGNMGAVLSMMYHKEHILENLTLTAVQGKAEAPKLSFNGGTLYFNGGTREIGGNSTINLVGTRTDGVKAKDNTVVNLYVPKGRDAEKFRFCGQYQYRRNGKGQYLRKRHHHQKRGRQHYRHR